MRTSSGQLSALSISLSMKAPVECDEKYFTRTRICKLTEKIAEFEHNGGRLQNISVLPFYSKRLY